MVSGKGVEPSLQERKWGQDSVSEIRIQSRHIQQGTHWPSDPGGHTEPSCRTLARGLGFPGVLGKHPVKCLFVNPSKSP